LIPGICSIEVNEHNKRAWVRFHKEGNRDALTGTSFKHMVSFYGLKGMLFKGMDVLEIGIGLGLCAKGFYEMGCNVYASDICKEAFNRIEKYIKGSFLCGEMEKLPSDFFDLAISHLVTQHMSEVGILRQFPEVIRSLKTDGVFCVQFAFSDIPNENNKKETIVGTPGDNKVSMLGGRMVRTPDYARQLIDRCGGKVIYTSDMTRFPKYKSGWYYMRVVKSGEGSHE